MYLIRLPLDARSAQVRRDMANPYDMHRTLVRAFVKSEMDRPPRILWRAEPTAAWSNPVVLVQAPERGDWSSLEAVPNYLKSEVQHRALEVDGSLEPGRVFRFRLFANPTVSRDGKRLGLVSEDAQLAWLSRQGERHGFVLQTTLVTASELLRARKASLTISVLQACFEGLLQVTDSHALKDAVLHGIGPAKAFGCGLLSLAKV